MKKLFLIVIGILIVGCGDSDQPSKPDNLIPEDKMSDIIYDVFLLNAAKGINKRILEQNGIFPQEYVFEKYKIDSLQFVFSNDYYSYDTNIYEDIMLRVRLKIELEQKKNDSINLKETKIRDSLREDKKLIKDTLNQYNIEASLIDTVLPLKKRKEKLKKKSKVFGDDKD